jgi:outer membrane protein assembly factor BamD (BamD/ComL family)
MSIWKEKQFSGKSAITQEPSRKNGMKKQNLFCVMMLTTFGVLAQDSQSSAGRSVGATNRRGGYATDQFEGFAEITGDERLEQKDWSLWFGVSEETPAKQLVYARQAYKDGRFRRARKGYEALIREWPTSKEAAQAQWFLAQLYEEYKNYDRAFQEYQYLLAFYAGFCPYNEVLDRQYKLANVLRCDNRSMFGWLLSEPEANRIRYEQIVRNAPRAPLAPTCMLIVGDIRREEKEMEEAIKVYDGLLNRYPRSSEAEVAAFFAASCRYNRSKTQDTNEENMRDAIAFIKTVLTIMPNHPQKEQFSTWSVALNKQLEESSYKTAYFYDTKQRNKAAAVAAYQRFLAEFRNSKYAEGVRQRLTELGPAEAVKGIEK